MRKIEHQMINAILHEDNWKSGNTRVETNDGVSKVYLHNNLIATITDYGVRLFDGGWQTNTTKSRLNAILFAYNGAWKVFQQNFQWYVMDNDRQVAFQNGYVLAF